jgi:hypothetical protein
MPQPVSSQLYNWHKRDLDACPGRKMPSAEVPVPQREYYFRGMHQNPGDCIVQAPKRYASRTRPDWRGSLTFPTETLCRTVWLPVSVCERILDGCGLTVSSASATIVLGVLKGPYVAKRSA